MLPDTVSPSKKDFLKMLQNTSLIALFALGYLAGPIIVDLFALIFTQKPLLFSYFFPVFPKLSAERGENSEPLLVTDNPIQGALLESISHLGGIVRTLTRAEQKSRLQEEGVSTFVKDLKNFESDSWHDHLNSPPEASKGTIKKLKSLFENTGSKIHVVCEDADNADETITFCNNDTILFTLKGGVLECSAHLNEKDFKLTQQISHALMFLDYGHKMPSFNLRLSLFPEEIQSELIGIRERFLQSESKEASTNATAIRKTYLDAEKAGQEKLKKALQQEKDTLNIDLNWFKVQTPFISTVSMAEESKLFCSVQFNQETQQFEAITGTCSNDNSLYLPGKDMDEDALLYQLIENDYHLNLLDDNTEVAKAINSQSLSQLKRLDLCTSPLSSILWSLPNISTSTSTSTRLRQAIIDYVEKPNSLDKKERTPQEKHDLTNEILMDVVKYLTPNTYQQIMQLIKQSEQVDDQLNIADDRTCELGCLYNHVYMISEDTLNSIKSRLGPPSKQAPPENTALKFSYQPLETLLSNALTEHNALAIIHGLSFEVKRLQKSNLLTLEMVHDIQKLARLTSGKLNQFNGNLSIEGKKTSPKDLFLLLEDFLALASNTLQEISDKLSSKQSLGLPEGDTTEPVLTAFSINADMPFETSTRKRTYSSSSSSSSLNGI